MAYCFRPLFFFLVVMVIGLGGRLEAQSTQPAQPADNKKGAEPLFYTIQVGSFSKEEDALSWFTRLAEQLPPDQKQFLRIEKIPPFHAVRVGKTDTREAIVGLLEVTQKITKKTPSILHGKYTPERISKLYDPTATPKSSSTPPATTQQATAPAAPEESLTTDPEVKTVPLPAITEEPLDRPNGSKAVAKTKAAGATKTAPPRAPHASATPPTQIPDAALKQKIIDKYLAKQSSTAKNAEALVKHSQSFPENPACINAECHAALKAVKNSHYPAGTGRCLACHKQINQKHPDANTADFQLLATGEGLCSTCHPKLQGKKNTHAPVTEGECLQCHAPHGSDNKFFLAVPAESQDKLCLQCHDKQITANKFTHGPVGLGSCTYCHDPHESDHEALLKDDPKTLCFECHVDIANGMKESTSIHQVVQTEGCTTCHQPHGSEFPNLLKQSGEAFCFTCHPAIEEKYAKSRSKHSGLYQEHGCGTCHQPHYSSYAKLLNNKELDLCLSCHSEENAISSKSPKDIALELKQTFLHEPLAQGQCAVCHDPHGSKFLTLLVGPYPDTIYASFEPEMYGLCFSCHDQDLLTSQTTDAATSFRNGSQNLHYLHATIPRKGRTCKTCHQPHASNGPKLINQSGSSFGDWQMSISFTTAGDGGSCMPGCHRKMGYNRGKEVDNSVKDSDFGEYHIEYKSVK